MKRQTIDLKKMVKVEKSLFFALNPQSPPLSLAEQPSGTQFLLNLVFEKKKSNTGNQSNKRQGAKEKETIR